MSDKIIASYQVKLHLHRNTETELPVPSSPPTLGELTGEVKTALDAEVADAGEHWTVSDAQRIDG